MLGELTLELLRAGALLGENEGSAMEESLRMLLDAWGSLIGRVGQFGCPPELAQGAAAVFQAYLQAGLAATAAAAFDEDDGQEEEGKAGAAALDERLSLISPIARAAPDATLPLLRQALEAKKQSLSQAMTSNLDPTVPLEELWWLVSFVLCIVRVRAIRMTSCFVYRRVWSRTCWPTPSKGRYRYPRIHSPSAARARRTRNATTRWTHSRRITSSWRACA
jgi:hypothetical protein